MLVDLDVKDTGEQIPDSIEKYCALKTIHNITLVAFLRVYLHRIRKVNNGAT